MAAYRVIMSRFTAVTHCYDYATIFTPLITIATPLPLRHWLLNIIYRPLFAAIATAIFSLAPLRYVSLSRHTPSHCLRHYAGHYADTSVITHYDELRRVSSPALITMPLSFNRLRCLRHCLPPPFDTAWRPYVIEIPDAATPTLIRHIGCHCRQLSHYCHYGLTGCRRHIIV